jgi:hypothetical protein
VKNRVVGFEPTAHLGSGLAAARIAALAPLRTDEPTLVSRNRIRHPHKRGAKRPDEALGLVGPYFRRFPSTDEKGCGYYSGVNRKKLPIRRKECPYSQGIAKGGSHDL